MKAIKWGLATLVVCAVAFATTTLFGEDNAAREARDRAEIEALMWKYTRALDSGDGATYASTYAVEGQFGTGANTTKGREALAKLVVRQPAAGAPARPPLYHMELNHWIEFVNKDRVRYHAYYLTVSGAMGQDTPPRIVAAGQSLDTMERVNGKWLIQTRDVAAKE
jgi:SnoaL-like domain